MEWKNIHDGINEIFQHIVLLGAALAAVGIGLTRVYKWTRTLDDILEYSKTSRQENKEINDRLIAHVEQEEARDKVRDVQLIEITSDLREITREVRPNGGSSIKDTINHIATEMGDVKERLASVEQWKKDNE